MILETPRLFLRPLSPQNILALIEGDGAFLRSFGVAAATGFGGYLRSGEVSPRWRAALETASEADPWTHGFAVIDRESNLVIGSVGFKGAPGPDGVVEIAYGIVPGLQRRGYATEAAAAGLQFAFANPSVRLVIAHTHPGSSASKRVLEKNGFSYIGDVEDPEDGLVCRFELARARFSPQP